MDRHDPRMMDAGFVTRSMRHAICDNTGRASRRQSFAHFASDTPRNRQARSARRTLVKHLYASVPIA